MDIAPALNGERNMAHSGKLPAAFSVFSVHSPYRKFEEKKILYK